MVSMSENEIDRIIKKFDLTGPQEQATRERSRDVVVTAGAGSGKTRTLVARYVSLLADGMEPRRVVAVTFTEKAAREMRSRVRQAVAELAQESAAGPERTRWEELGAGLDSARIGTIHSLCAEILRAHPAEAQIDPRFEVLDEGLAVAFKAQAVQDTLAALAEDTQFTRLIEALGTASLKSLLAFLLGRRLDAQEFFLASRSEEGAVLRFLERSLNREEIKGCIDELEGMTAEALLRDAGDALAEQAANLRNTWRQAVQALANQDAAACALALFRARRNNLRRNIGLKQSRVKAITADLVEQYDSWLNPVIGGKDSKDPPPDPETERLQYELLPLVRQAFERLAAAYRQVLQQRRALDFDDLEAGALALLHNSEIQAHWQAEIQSLLVDEFQDTNERQRTLIKALAGAPGRRFIVGDARQSIYRFRRADVTVFRTEQREVEKAGGLVVDLGMTYRTHEPLLFAMSDLLHDVMGTQEIPDQPYYVPFSPLAAYRKQAPEHILPPHIEVVMGTGEDAESARPQAARALAQRLGELKAEGQIRSWDDVALLLRASTGFVDYETTLEDAGIPFVTVAGRGFYDRPEIRDLLNMLRALSDPLDDLAMAGLLRSPAFGLSDAALYLLRLQRDEPISYRLALQGDLSHLEDGDRGRAARARAILDTLLPLVDRVPVCDLLKALVDATDYRAIMAAGSQSAGGRLWRNLDKLVEDARAGGQCVVRDFLDYLETLNTAGAREGEAPSEAQGAVRLMTIHKSKGLEFPLVVLADAGRSPNNRAYSAYLLPELGLALKLEPPPLAYRLAKQLDQQQDEAESKRLLYVALTRAKDRLLISGHIAKRSGTWMDSLCGAAGVDIAQAIEQAGTPLEGRTSTGLPVWGWCIPPLEEDKEEPGGELVSPPPPLAEPELAPIYRPLALPKKTLESSDEPIELHKWRATGPAGAVPPSVLGQVVHKAIELWLFPGNPALQQTLETAAANAGLADAAQRVEAVHRAVELLKRLQAHPLYYEIEAATERFHELPYTRQTGEYAETGVLDLLYRTAEGWRIIDFKTDSISSPGERARLVDDYTAQLRRYANAVVSLLGQPVTAHICFLDDQGKVSLVNLSSRS
jgi:ATP-dependent helicase/nuclease subunit A